MRTLIVEINRERMHFEGSSATGSRLLLGYFQDLYGNYRSGSQRKHIRQISEKVGGINFKAHSLIPIPQVELAPV
jgi:hypothetical protein